MTDPVKEQYTRWSYPEPVHDLEGLWQGHDPNLLKLHYAYWPDREYWPGMRILVAGCGSNQAANIAYRNPSAQVLGIDLSPTSLEHERWLQRKYGLENLALEEMPIEQVDRIGQEFDLVIATGVLHHLADPARGLATLGRRLALHGVLAVMVYGRYFRTGVYMLQELFQRLGLGQTAEDVAAVRYTVDHIQADHLVRNYLRHDPARRHDTDLVDTFLHPTDRAYTVPECLGLVEKAGLHFQGWHENAFYYPNSQMNSEHPLFARLNALPEPDLWAAMELHHGGAGRHEFFCCRADRPQHAFRLKFTTDPFLDLVPVRRVTRSIDADPAQGRGAAVQRPPFPQFSLDEAQRRLFNCIDGQRTVRQCVADCNVTTDDPAALTQFAANFLISLWRVGYLLLRIR